MNEDVTTISLSALLNNEKPLAKDTIVPLWGLCRTTEEPPANVLDYCRIQLKGNNGARFEQSAALFTYFSEFFRKHLVAGGVSKINPYTYVGIDEAAKAFSSRGGRSGIHSGHIVPINVVVDVSDTNNSDASCQSPACETNNTKNVAYPCWGLQMPRCGVEALYSTNCDKINNNDNNNSTPTSSQPPSCLLTIDGNAADGNATTSVPLTPTSGFALPSLPQSESKEGDLSASASMTYIFPTTITNDETKLNIVTPSFASEVQRLASSFFYKFDPLTAVYTSSNACPTGVTVQQHASLLSILKEYQQKALLLADTSAKEKENSGAAFVFGTKETVLAVGKSISMKIPAQAVWRFDFYEGVPSAESTSDANTSPDSDSQTAKNAGNNSGITHNAPVLALDSEFLGSLLVYLRKLEREKQKQIGKEKSAAAGGGGAAHPSASPLIAPPVQWRDLDRTQRKRVREIVSLLGLEPLYGYISAHMAMEGAESNNRNSNGSAAAAAAPNAAEDAANSSGDTKGSYTCEGSNSDRCNPPMYATSVDKVEANAAMYEKERGEEERRTIGLVERTMLIAALKAACPSPDGGAGAEREGGEDNAPKSDFSVQSQSGAAGATSASALNTKKEESAVAKSSKSLDDNDAWVREFKAKVANFSRVDALIEERNRMLKMGGSNGGGSATAADAAAACYVPPHPSIDDDDLELPVGGTCYKCGVSGHTAETCKY